SARGPAGGPRTKARPAHRAPARARTAPSATAPPPKPAMQPRSRQECAASAARYAGRAGVFQRRRYAWSSIPETVAYAIDGLDSIKGGIDLLELPADALDMAVDRAVINIHIVVISKIHQLRAGLNMPRILHKRPDKQEFRHRHIDRLAVPAAHMARLVER